MKLTVIFAAGMMLCGTALAECDESSTTIIEYQDGTDFKFQDGDDLFVKDKRSPEERCDTTADWMQSSGDPKIYKDERSSEVFASGGGSDIFMNPRAPEDREIDEFIESGGDPKIFKDPESAEGRDDPY